MQTLTQQKIARLEENSSFEPLRNIYNIRVRVVSDIQTLAELLVKLSSIMDLLAK